jgi:hypothetical protein
MQPDEHTFFVPELYAAGPSNQRTTNTDRFVSTLEVAQAMQI